MLDALFDFVADGGVSKTTRTGIIVSVAIVVVAALFFALLYVRYQRVRKKSTTLQDENLIRRGRLDLKKRCLDANGCVRREALFQEHVEIEEEEDETEKIETVDKADDEKKKKKKKKTIGDQVFDTLTGGKLVHMINTFHVRTKNMSKKYAPQLSPLERLAAEKQARMADASVNPLYQMKTAPPRESESDSDSDDSESSDSSDVEEFDCEDKVENA